MKHWQLSTSTALALVFSAHASFAVTPEEVWANWQALATGTGSQITATGTTKTGPTLEVTGVSTSFTDPTNGGTFSSTIDKISFTDRGDGTVEVKMADSIPVTMAIPDAPGAAPTVVSLLLGQPGMSIIAGGSATETSYDFTAPTFSIALTEVKPADGSTVDVKAEGTGTNLTGKYLVSTSGTTTMLDSSATMASLAFTVSGSDPDSASTFAVKGALADVVAASKGTFLGAESMANMAAALKAGFMVDSALSYGAMTLDADITDSTGPSKVTGQMAGGDFKVAMDQVRIDYGFGMTGASFVIQAPGMPFPQVTTAFAESAFRVLLPASKSDTPQDFSFLTKLVDFTISEEVWGMIDPGQQLPRDPATLIVDAKGTGFWTVEIMDPAAQEAAGAAPPGQINSLDLTQLLVKAAGAEVGATGAVTFDNTDMATFGGAPVPTGKVNVTLKGINALLDKLVAMGLIPEDQIMGGRMMLAMFAKPGAGPDELISEIEFKDKGIFANGQQLQ